MENCIGIEFSEKMEGGLAMGALDFERGEKQGKKEGSVFTMHATITVPDMDRFLEEKDHAGGLAGNIDFSPFGEGIPTVNGQFNLFSPTANPELKLMVYEFGFNHNDQDYYFYGKKEVRDDPAFDLWKDTTTLFSKLHKGTDTSGAVVGAGILTLGIGDLIRLVKSMKAINVVGNKERLEAFTKFGRFFLGELWDTYVKHA